MSCPAGADIRLLPPHADGAGTVERPVHWHGPRTYRLAVLITGSLADAEAISPAVLRMIARRAPTMPDEAVLDPLVVRHTIHARHEVPRRPRGTAGCARDVARPVFHTPGHLGEVWRDWTKMLENLGARADAGRLRLNGLHRHPPEERVVFVLYDIEGIDGPAIDEMLGVTIPVKSCVHRSRLWLRHSLANAFDPGSIKSSINRVSRDG